MYSVVELAEQIIEMDRTINYLSERVCELEKELYEEKKLSDKIHKQNVGNVFGTLKTLLDKDN